MTKFAEAKFSVAALPTKEYADGYERTFTKVEDGRACTECAGTAKMPCLDGTPAHTSCKPCNGTGLRAWQLEA